MPLRRFAARSGLPVALLLQMTACGAEAPPPRVRSALSARAADSPSGGRSAPSGNTASLGDSALEPAAMDASKSEDWPRAEALYRELARRQPRHAGAKHGLGVALLRQNKNDAAITALEASLQLSDDGHTRLDLAAAFAEVGRYPSALPHLRKAVELAPHEPAAWAGLVDALIKVEKPDAAADILRDSRAPCPACASNDGWNHAADEVAAALAAKAQKQIAEGNASGARKSAEGALAVRPDLPEAQLVLGKVARAEGNTKAAASAYRKAVERLPDAKAESGANARLELATLLIGGAGDGSGAGDGKEAVKLAEQVVAARGDDGAALDTLGRACDATRDKTCARKAYAKLVKLRGGDGKSQGALEHARLRMKELKSRHR
jgi:predicted Zn-dependent protease